MAMPSGRRISAPMPVAKASGSAPNIADNVVMRMGRNRSVAAKSAASRTLKPHFPLGVKREIDENDAVLLHDADKQQNADEGDHGEFEAAQLRAPEARRDPPKAESK